MPVISLGMDIRGLRQGADQARRSLSEISDLADRAKDALGALGAGLTLAQIVKDAKEYETALNNMARVTDESAATLRAMVAGLGPELGTQTELMQGLYTVISAGVTDTGRAMETLTAASKAAKVAGVEQSAAVDALTSVMAAYEGQISSAAEASDLLFAIERNGKTSFQELVPVIGQVASVARTVGASADEMGAAFSAITMTSGGTAAAATQLRAALVALLNPNETLKKVLAELGAESGRALVEARGLLGAFQDIERVSRGMGVELATVLGGAEAMGGALAMAAQGGQTYGSMLDSIREKTGKSEEAFARWANTFEGASTIAANIFTDISSRIGQEFLPLLTSGLATMNTALGSAMEHFDDVRSAALAGAAAFAAYKVATSETVAALLTRGKALAGAVLAEGGFNASLLERAKAEQLAAAQTYRRAAADKAAAAATASRLQTEVGMARAALANAASAQEVAAATARLTIVQAEATAAREALALATRNLAAAEAQLAGATANVQRVQNMGNAMSALTAAMNGARTAISGVVAMLGGPWGVALMTAAGGAAYLATKTDEAAEAADKLVGTLQDQHKNISITAQALETMGKRLEDLDKQEQAIARRRTWELYREQIARVQDAFETMFDSLKQSSADALNSIAEEYDLPLNTENITNGAKALQEYKERLDELIASFLRGEIDAAKFREELERYRKEIVETYGANNSLVNSIASMLAPGRGAIAVLADMATHMGMVGKKADETAGKVEELADVLGGLARATQGISIDTDGLFKAVDTSEVDAWLSGLPDRMQKQLKAVQGFIKDTGDQLKTMQEIAAGDFSAIEDHADAIKKVMDNVGRAFDNSENRKNASRKSTASAAAAARDYAAELASATEQNRALSAALSRDRGAEVALANAAAEEKYRKAVEAVNKAFQAEVRRNPSSRAREEALRAIKLQNAEMERTLTIQANQEKGVQAQAELIRGQLSFYQDLSKSGLEYGDAIGLQNQLIDIQARKLRELKIPDRYIREWERLQKLMASKDPFDAMQRGLMRFTAEYSDSARRWEDASYSFAKSFQSATEQMFERFLDTGELSFSSLGKSFLAMLKTMAAQALAQPIVLSVVGVMGGVLGGGGSAAGGGSAGASGGGGMSGILGDVAGLARGWVTDKLFGAGTSSGLLTGLANTVNGWAASAFPSVFATSAHAAVGADLFSASGAAAAYGQAATNAAATATTTFTSAMGTALGAAGLGYGLGSLAGQLLSPVLGLDSQTTSMGAGIGGGIGAAVGSIIPGLGTLAGGAIGTLLGGAVGALFGGGEELPELYMGYELNFDSFMPNTWANGDNGAGKTAIGLRSSLEEAGNQALAFARDIRQAVLDFDANLGTQFWANVVGMGGAAKRVMFEGDYINQGNIETFFEGMTKTVQKRMVEALEKTDFSAITRSANGAVMGTAKDLKDTLEKGIQFFALGDAMGDFKEDFERVVSQKLMDAFSQLDTSGLALEIDRSSIQGWARAYEAVAAFEEVQSAIDAVIRPAGEFTATMESVTEQFDGWIDTLRDLGWQEEAIAEIEAQRAEYLATYAEALRRSAEQDLTSRVMSLAAGASSDELAMLQTLFAQYNERKEVEGQYGAASDIYAVTQAVQQAELAQRRIEQLEKELAAVRQADIQDATDARDALKERIAALQEAIAAETARIEAEAAARKAVIDAEEASRLAVLEAEREERQAAIDDRTREAAARQKYLDAVQKAIDAQQKEINARLKALKKEQSALKEQISAAERIRDTFESIADRLLDARKDIWGSDDDNLMGTALDSRLADFDAAFEMAMRGDADALNELSGLSADLLALGRDRLPSREAYDDLFFMVSSRLKEAQEYARTTAEAQAGIVDALQEQLDPIEREIAAMEGQLEVLSAQEEELREQTEILREFRDVTAEMQSALDEDMRLAREGVAYEIGLLRDELDAWTQEQLKALSPMNDELEGLNASLDEAVKHLEEVRNAADAQTDAAQETRRTAEEILAELSEWRRQQDDAVKKIVDDITGVTTNNAIADAVENGTLQAQTITMSNAEHILATLAEKLNRTRSGGRTDWTAASAQEWIRSQGMTFFEWWDRQGQYEQPDASFDTTAARLRVLEELSRRLAEKAVDGKTSWTLEEARAYVGSSIDSWLRREGWAEGFSEFAEPIRDVTLRGTQQTIAALARQTSGIVSGVTSATDAAAQYQAGVMSGGFVTLNGSVEGTTAAVNGLGGSMAAGMSGMSEGLASGVASGLSGSFTALDGTVSAGFASLGTSTETGLTSFGTSTKDGMTSFGTSTKDGLTSFGTSTKDGLTSMSGAITSGFSAMGTALSALGSGLGGWASSLLSQSGLGQSISSFGGTQSQIKDYVMPDLTPNIVITGQGDGQNVYQRPQGLKVSQVSGGRIFDLGGAIWTVKGTMWENIDNERRLQDGQNGVYGSHYATEGDLLWAKARANNAQLIDGRTDWTAESTRAEIIRQKMTVEEWYRRHGAHEGFARGGITPANRPFWVGEEGPELMMSPERWRVVDSRRSEALASGALDGGAEGVLRMVYDVLRQTLTKVDGVFGATRKTASYLGRWNNDGMPATAAATA